MSGARTGFIHRREQDHSHNYIDGDLANGHNGGCCCTKFDALVRYDHSSSYIPSANAHSADTRADSTFSSASRNDSGGLFMPA